MKYFFGCLLACCAVVAHANPDIRDFTPGKINYSNLTVGGGAFVGAHFGLPGSALIEKDGLPYQTYDEREVRGGLCSSVRDGAARVVQCKDVRIENYKPNPNPAYDPDVMDDAMFADREFPCYYRPSTGGTQNMLHWRLKWYNVRDQGDGTFLVDPYLRCWP